MEKFIKNLFMVMLLAAFSVSFTSCGDDDGDDDIATNNTVVGTWKCIDEDDGAQYTLVLKSNGSGTIEEKFLDGSGMASEGFDWATSESSTGKTIITFVHTTGKNYILTDPKESSTQWYYTLVGNSLIFGGMTFSR